MLFPAISTGGRAGPVYAVKQRVYGRAAHSARADRPARGRVRPESCSLRAGAAGVVSTNPCSDTDSDTFNIPGIS